MAALPQMTAIFDLFSAFRLMDMVSAHTAIISLCRNSSSVKKKSEAQQAVEPNGSGASCFGFGPSGLAVGSL